MHTAGGQAPILLEYSRVGTRGTPFRLTDCGATLDIVLSNLDVAIAETGKSVALSVVNDGTEALRFLRREGGYENVPRPNLILLDLNLPKKDGRQVLAEIKADDDLKMIPVVVLTTSDAQLDIRCAYGLHANCYVTKPADFDAFVGLVQSIEQFWLSTAKVPS